MFKYLKKNSMSVKYPENSQIEKTRFIPGYFINLAA
jgi:hypothetical protein